LGSFDCIHKNKNTFFFSNQEIWYPRIQMTTCIINLMYIFDSQHDTGDCPNIEIVSRDSWGARRPISPSTLHNPVPYFFIHHTAGQCLTFQECSHEMKGVQSYHMDHRRK